MANDRPARPTEVFEAAIARLRDSIDDANSQTCFLARDPDQHGAASGKFTYAVTPSPSVQFAPGQFDGGGVKSAEVTWYLAVTVHAPVTALRDQGHRSEGLLLDQLDAGLFERWRLVVVALAEQQLVGIDGLNLLNQAIIPVNADLGIAQQRARFGTMQQIFELQFDLDLETSAAAAHP